MSTLLFLMTLIKVSRLCISPCSFRTFPQKILHAPLHLNHFHLRHCSLRQLLIYFLPLQLGSASYWFGQIWPAACLCKLLFWNAASPLHWWQVCSYFLPTTAALSRDHMALKPWNIYYLTLSRKCLPASALYTGLFWTFHINGKYLAWSFESGLFHLE